MEGPQSRHQYCTKQGRQTQRFRCTPDRAAWTPAWTTAFVECALEENVADSCTQAGMNAGRHRDSHRSVRANLHTEAEELVG